METQDVSEGTGKGNGSMGYGNIESRTIGETVKNSSLELPTLAFVHDDLDGTACAITCLLAFPDTHIFFTNAQNIKKMLLSCPGPTSALGQEVEIYRLIVADISVREDSKDGDAVREVSRRKRCAEFIFADHHPESNWSKPIRNDSGHWFYNQQLCAAKILSYGLDMAGYPIPPDQSKDLHNFLDAVCEYDLWKVKGNHFETGYQLDALLKIMGPQKFIQRGAKVSFTKEEENQIKTYCRNRDQAVGDSLKQMVVTKRVAVTKRSPFRNDIAEELFKTQRGVDVAAFVNGSEISIRTRKERSVDLSLMAYHLFDGGGHKMAAGGILPLHLINLSGREKLIAVAERIESYLTNGTNTL